MKMHPTKLLMFRSPRASHLPSTNLLMAGPDYSRIADDTSTMFRLGGIDADDRADTRAPN